MPVQLNWVSGPISAVFEEHFRLLNLHVEQLSQSPLQNGVHTSCEPSANELCKRHLLKTCVYDFLNSIHHTLAAHCAPKQSTISTTCSTAFDGKGGGGRPMAQHSPQSQLPSPRHYMGITAALDPCADCADHDVCVCGHGNVAPAFRRL